MSICRRHFNSNFAHSFDFHCLTNFVKRINLSWTVSLQMVCVIINIHFTPWRVISGWYGEQNFGWNEMSTTSIHLLNSKFKVTCKHRDIGCRYITAHSKESMCECLTLHSPFCLFSHENTVAILPSWVLWDQLLLMKASHTQDQESGKNLGIHSCKDSRQIKLRESKWILVNISVSYMVRIHGFLQNSTGRI